MAGTDWQMRGVELGACNCDWGCPCQFNGPPTPGHCGGVWFMRIEDGRFGALRLDGLAWACVMSFPGAVHEGNGAQQFHVAREASDEQLAALDAILSGRESEEGSIFHIFGAVTPHKQPTLRSEIEFTCDLEARTGYGRVADRIRMRTEPIRNPVTGAPHRALLTLPEGFEFRTAEIASGSFRVLGPIALAADGKHAHLARVHWNRHGCVD